MPWCLRCRAWYSLTPRSPCTARGARPPPSRLGLLARPMVQIGWRVGLAALARRRPLRGSARYARPPTSRLGLLAPPMVQIGWRVGLAALARRRPLRASARYARPPPSRAHLQERGIARERAKVDLLPRIAFGVEPALDEPRRRVRVARRRRELREIAQPEHALDDDARGYLAATRVEQNQSCRAARRATRTAEKPGEIDDAEQVAADVREPEEPRLRERHRDDRGYRDHLAGIGEANQPASAAAGEPEAGGLDLRSRLAGKPRGELLLERAQVEAGGARHRRVPARVSRARRSSRAATRDRPASPRNRAHPAAGPRSCRFPGS